MAISLQRLSTSDKHAVVIDMLRDGHEITGHASERSRRCSVSGKPSNTDDAKNMLPLGSSYQVHCRHNHRVNIDQAHLLA